ncbi:MAG: DinB family protein [Anaerolineae bacterium]|nr:DinB family protein [Anaerolineae bacterium]
MEKGKGMRDYLRSLYRYTFWADDQLFDCVAQLTEAQLRQDQVYSIGSVWVQCHHLFRVEYWWFLFLRTGTMPAKWESDEESLPWLWAQWASNRDAILAYLDGITDAELQRLVKPPHWEAGEAPIAVWQAMLQVANHSTDHRAQILRLLFDLGAPTFEQDYLNYLDSLM